MRVIRRTAQAGDRVVALGTFDGVHRGHQALLASAFTLARNEGIPLRVCTFCQHPLQVLRPEAAPPILSTIPEKARRMDFAGADEMELMPFTRNMADMEPEFFLSSLRSRMNVRAVAAGWNYTFGRKGRGDAELLLADGKKHGYQVIIEEATTCEDGTAISSTLVRQTLSQGNTEAAAKLLGYPYSLTGLVEEGKHLGHRLGFATANIRVPHHKQLPVYGVYTCIMETVQGTFPGIVNIGTQPTLPSGKLTVEAHALTGHPELYGCRVRLTFLKRLRPEMRFDSVKELQKQLEADRDTAFRLFDLDEHGMDGKKTGIMLPCFREK